MCSVFRVFGGRSFLFKLLQEFLDVDADVGVVFVKSQLFPDAASDMVMPLYVGEVRYHLSVEAYGIQTAMFYFHICKFLCFQEFNESRM